MKSIYIILGIIFLSLNISAQQDQIYIKPESKVDTVPKLEIISEYRDGSIYLRWASNDASTWYENSFSGYKLYRIDVNEKEGIPLMETIDSSITMAWSKEKFKTYIDSTNENILIAAQCLYGEWEKNIHFTGINQELINRYSFAMFAADIDWNTAISLGLAFEDKNIESGKTYFYKVVPQDTSTRLKEAYLSIKAKEMKKTVPIILDKIESENSITIQWDKEVHKDFFSGYYIERSKDGNSYTRLNKRPIIGGESKEFPASIISFTDSVKNYIKYHYRIIGITPFGKLSTPSKALIAMGRDKTPPATPQGISINCDVTNKMVNINWESVSSDDLKNYVVSRSNKSDGVFEIVSNPILKSNTTHFSEITPDITKYYYYRISAIDTAGNYSTTLPYIAAFRDTIAPKEPTGLKGIIDSIGFVSLTWNKNIEEDLAGYHIYMSNSLSHMFVKISSHTLSENSFKDTITLKTFTENIYYKITAIDFHGHFSDFSETIRLKKPDIIPPFPPSIKNFKYNQVDGTIKIYWSPSKSSDIDHHELYKYKNSKWQKAQDFNDKSNEYIDQAVELGKAYKYKIIAIDDDGLHSNNNAFVVVRATDKRLPSIPKIISCKFEDDKNIKIEWASISDKKHKNYIIYRSINDQPFIVHSRTSDTFYLDNDISKNKKYSYAVKQTWKDGKKSKMSESKIPDILR